MIPIVAREALEEAMRRFDAELRGSEEWADWETNKAHKYAIEHDGKRYPVKKVVSLASDLPVSEFSGGQRSDQANAYVEQRGFRVVRLTSGNNPAWLRDELILALDLYLRTRSSPPAKTSENIQRLSDLLNKLAKVLGMPNYDRYRNRNGVYMKLMNFRALDPAYTSEGKVGLTRGGKGDEEVWEEFATDPERCHQVANAIRAAVEADDCGETPMIGGEFNQEYEAAEGRVLTVQHLRRERDRKIVEMKKEKVLKEKGRLSCEACAFDFAEMYKERGGGFIECHHEIPLHALEPGRKTKLDDLRLLCANCHRMIHVKRPWLLTDQLRSIVFNKT